MAPHIRVLAWVLCIVVLGISVGPSSAAAEKRSVSDYEHTVWTKRDGAPQDTWAIAQTTDGWLWFGGPSGLRRFDGISFEKRALDRSDSDRSDAVSSLFALAGGDLLVGRAAGGISLLSGERFESLDDERTRSAGTVFEFAEGEHGTIWAATRNGLLRFDQRTWQLIGSDWGYPGGSTRCVLVDGRGNVWVATPNGVLRLTSGSRRFEVVSHNSGVYELMQSSDGRVWMVSIAGLQQVSGPEPQPPRSERFNSRTSYASLFDDAGFFWSWWLSSEVQTAEPTIEGISSLGSVKTALQDREGNLWFGDQSAVIHRLRRRLVDTLPLLPTAAGVVPMATFAPDDSGAMWIGMDFSGYSHYALDGIWKFDGTLRQCQPGEVDSVTTLAKVANGDIWMGGRGVVWRLSAGRFVKVATLPTGGENAIVRAISEDATGALWITVEGLGLFRRDGTTWQRNGGVAGISMDLPYVQANDASGRVWLGYADGTVARIEAGRAVVFGTADGLHVGAITSIHVGRHVLVGGERGLAIATGNGFISLEPSDPTAFDVVTGIVEEPDGDVWLNSARGAIHIGVARLEEVVAAALRMLPIDVFDESDGFPGPLAAAGLRAPPIGRSTDGRIWFAGHEGIGIIDPSQVRRASSAPRVVILSLDGRGTEGSAASEVTLDAGRRSIRFVYTALRYSHPDRLRFRYRLEGLDHAWTDAGARREATYANLGPGHFRFVVQATDGSSAWSDAASGLHFLIPPTFVQSRLFAALCASAALAAVFLLYRIRVAQITSRERTRAAAVLRERERIAREIHDTLLQSMQGLILKLDGVVRELSPASSARKTLASAIERGERVLVEGRDQIQGIRSDPKTKVGLAMLLARLGEEMHVAVPGFSVAIEGEERSIREDVFEATYGVGREAIVNAFRHAHAGSIDVQLTYGDDAFTLSVRDDGMGFAAGHGSSSPDRHWGLTGMKERADGVGGTLEVWSRPGAGTEIQLVLTADRAYLDTARATRWRSAVWRLAMRSRKKA